MCFQSSEIFLYTFFSLLFHRFEIKRKRHANFMTWLWREKNERAFRQSSERKKTSSLTQASNLDGQHVAGHVSFCANQSICIQIGADRLSTSWQRPDIVHANARPCTNFDDNNIDTEHKSQYNASISFDIHLSLIPTFFVYRTRACFEFWCNISFKINSKHGNSIKLWQTMEKLERCIDFKVE